MNALRVSALVTAMVIAWTLQNHEARAQPWLEAELGPVIASRLDVRVPGDTGTQFSLVSDLDASPALYGRVRLGWDLGRHRLSALIAPVRLWSHGSFNRPVRFQGESFARGTDVEARYQFDTYRFSYTFLALKRETLELGVGATVLLRDAEIKLEDSSTSARKTNFGVVPLLRLSLRYQPYHLLALALDAEGLAAPQGRAFDVLTAVEFPAWKHATPYVGYRFLEGGADNDEVYNFAYLNFVAFGFRGTL